LALKPPYLPRLSWITQTEARQVSGAYGPPPQAFPCVHPPSCLGITKNTPFRWAPARSRPALCLRGGEAPLVALRTVTRPRPHESPGPYGVFPLSFLVLTALFFVGFMFTPGPLRPFSLARWGLWVRMLSSPHPPLPLAPLRGGGPPRVVGVGGVSLWFLLFSCCVWSMSADPALYVYLLLDRY
jgi:hypothetical protein